MIRSMTGYGEAERELDAGRVRVEIKTVNHRYFNPSLRTPPGFDALEPSVTAWLKERIARGHVSCAVTLDRDEAAAGEPLPELDLERARRYRSLLDGLRRDLGLEEPVTLDHLLGFRDLFRAPDPPDAAEVVDEETLRQAVLDAADRVVAMREAEGERLRDDLEARAAAISGQLDVIQERAPERLEAERARLRERIRELTESAEVDEDRLAREVAYMADKWDINEEIVRFRAHLAHFRELLEEPAQEPAGKRLGFVVQEMHREANTIGAKGNDPGISQAVVAIKEEIERLREQVENVE